VRKTIRRSVFLTATAGLAILGFGLGQASAALPALPPAPALPGLPTLPGAQNPLSNLPILSDATDEASDRAGLPSLPILDKLTSKLGLGNLLSGAGGLGGLTGQGGQGDGQSAGQGGQSGGQSGGLGGLTNGLGGLGGLTNGLGGLGGLTNGLGGLGGVTNGLGARSGLPVASNLPKLPAVSELSGIAEVPNMTDLVLLLAGVHDRPELQNMPVNGVPTDDMALPSADAGNVNLGVDPRDLPASGQADKLASVVPSIHQKTNKLPLTAVTDPSAVTGKLTSALGGADVDGLPTPQVSEVSTATNVLETVTQAPATAGLSKVAQPDALVSQVNTAVQTVTGLTGAGELTSDLPELAAV
jgi:hypothetical protein